MTTPPGVIALTADASVELDFGLVQVQTVVMTQDTTFTSKNLADDGRAIQVKILASGGARNLTFPAGWKFLGAAAPASLASGKTAMLALQSFSAVDAGVVVGYSVEP